MLGEGGGGGRQETRGRGHESKGSYFHNVLVIVVRVLVHIAYLEATGERFSITHLTPKRVAQYELFKVHTSGQVAPIAILSVFSNRNFKHFSCRRAVVPPVPCPRPHVDVGVQLVQHPRGLFFNARSRNVGNICPPRRG